MTAEQAGRDLGGVGQPASISTLLALEGLAVPGGIMVYVPGSISTASAPSVVSMPFADLSMREVPSSMSALTLAAATAFLMETSLPGVARRSSGGVPDRDLVVGVPDLEFRPGRGVAALDDLVDIESGRGVGLGRMRLHLGRGAVLRRRRVNAVGVSSILARGALVSTRGVGRRAGTEVESLGGRLPSSPVFTWSTTSPAARARCRRGTRCLAAPRRRTLRPEVPRVMRARLRDGRLTLRLLV